MNADTYHVDINVTTLCNLACKYCFVGGKGSHFESEPEIIHFISRVLTSKLFIQNYKYLSVNFWGGEPLLYPNFVKAVVDNFYDLGAVRFFIYSNGTKLDSIKDMLLKYKNFRVGNMPKILMQVSYDGEPLHSMYRDAGKEAREAINWLDKNDLEFTIKSTVPYSGFKYMYDAYLDIKRFALTLKKKINYFPTIDHYSVDTVVPVYEEDLKNSLIKIARKELEDKTNFFYWFRSNRAICSAGADMVAVDCDGKVYPCHGCLYEDKASHLIGHINEEDIIDKILLRRHQIKDVLNSGDTMCPDCPVGFCLRCNHAKFIRSEKTDYLLKWFDGKSQPELCRFYNINNKVKEAFEEIRRRAM